MYRINSQIILPTNDENYIRIITIYPQPKKDSVLYPHVKSLRTRTLSKFSTTNSCQSQTQNTCITALIDPETNNPFCIEQLTECVDLLLQKNYKPDYELTKMLSKHQPNGSYTVLFYIVDKN